MWSSLAVRNCNGNDREKAVENRDRLAKEMTSEQITEAQRIAREWKPKDSGSQ